MKQTHCTIYGSEDFFQHKFYCSYRYPCPDQCMCTKNYYGYNKVDCRGSNHHHIPTQFPATTTILDLSDIRIETIRENQFASCPLVEKLVLNNAFISHIEAGAFLGLYNLHEVQLNGNDLSSLDLDATFGDTPLESLSIGHNPWDCSCEAGLQFINSAKWIHVISDLDNVTCVNHSHSNNITAIIDLNARYEHCASEWRKSDARIIGLSVSFVGLLLLGLVASLCLRFRKLLHVCIYYKCGVRLGSERDDNIRKPYDAFVSFSQHDMDFVRNELIPQLESPEMPYRLCVHHKDWPVGHSISNTIAESVKHSHRTILLLSDNFMRSEWCNYEFQTAHNQVLKKRDRCLIIVLLQNVLPENMDEDMLLYTQTYTYIKRSDSWFW